jgi:hypothetical protein
MKWRNKNGSSATAGNLKEKLKDVRQCFDKGRFQEAWDKL